jgi:hypothetical protein
MGIAAYNRGTEVFSRQIYANLPDHNDVAIRDLNTMPRGTNEVFGKTVVRRLGSRWILMNRKEGGFSSRGYEYRTLGDLFAAWNVYVVGYGNDAHSFYYEVGRP